MNTTRLRKFWINDIVIIAPLKSATRWLYDRSHKSDFIHIDDLKSHTQQSYYFLYREGRSHLESALHTDYIINEFDLDKTISELLSHKSPHWRGDLYEHIHRAWCYNKFQMVEYTNVCELIGDWDVKPNMYDFSMETNPITKRNVLDMVDTKTLSILYDMADNNNYWLEQILNGNDKIISKSVADALKIESDLKTESHITMLTNRIQTLNTQFVKELWDLKQINEKLQSKLDYTESMMGKPPKKLI